MQITKKSFTFRDPLETLNSIDQLVIHHTSRTSMTADEAHEYHQTVKGWSGIGYNFLIEKSGELVEGRGFYVGAHAYGYNRNSLGICVTGDFDHSYETPTTAQTVTLDDFLIYLLQFFKLAPENIVGHRELQGAQTTCPGANFDMKLLRERIAVRLKENS